jgi:hypothetical protein
MQLFLATAGATPGAAVAAQTTPSTSNPFCTLPDAAWVKLREALQVNGISASPQR